MVFEIDPTLHPDIAPLAFLLGRWEGAGVIGYPGTQSRQFGQELVVEHDGRPFLSWTSRSWLIGEDGALGEPVAAETGYWRPAGDGELCLLLAHPTGILEMYFGRKDPARPVVQVATDGVLRAPGTRDYSAAQRMLGLVDGRLMWALDIAADGHPMTSHMSAELRRVD